MSTTPTFTSREFSPPVTAHYNKVWNWYLENLIHGEFENIINNTSYRRDLSSIIDKVDGDLKIVILVPTIINNDDALICDLLTKFFQNHAGSLDVDDESKQRDDISNKTSFEVIITHFGTLESSQSAIIMASSKISVPDDISFGEVSNYNQMIELNSIISGESGYVPSMNSKSVSMSTTSSITSNSHDIDDDESSIDSFHPSVSLPPSPKYSLTRVSTIQNEDEFFENQDDLDQGSSTHVPNTPRSSTEQQPIVQIESKESRETRDDDHDYDDDDDDDDLEGEVEEHDAYSVYSDDSSIDSVEYVPSTITTRTSGKFSIRYKMVLNYILFKDDEQNKRTAIRQIDEDGISDDWLLYDERFRMDNIELLYLKEIMEEMKYTRKILFYDLKLANNNEVDDDEEGDDQLHENDLSVVEFNGNGSRDDDQHTEGHSIRFTQSNQTTIQASEYLSKTNTIKTHHGSIKSEYNLYKPDSLFSKIERSKSTPSNSKMKKLRLRHGHPDKNCIIM